MPCWSCFNTVIWEVLLNNIIYDSSSFLCIFSYKILFIGTYYFIPPYLWKFYPFTNFTFILVNKLWCNISVSCVKNSHLLLNLSYNFSRVKKFFGKTLMILDCIWSKCLKKNSVLNILFVKLHNVTFYEYKVEILYVNLI